MTLYDQTKISCFNTLLVLPCCYMPFNKKALLIQNATAHLTIQFLIRYDCKLPKSIQTALIFVALDNFTFGIVISVSNFTK